MAADGQSASASVRELLQEVHAAHEREVAHLGETISRLTAALQQRVAGAQWLDDAQRGLDAEAPRGEAASSWCPPGGPAEAGPAEGAARSGAGGIHLEYASSASESGEGEGCDEVHIADVPRVSNKSHTSSAGSESLRYQQTSTDGSVMVEDSIPGVSSQAMGRALSDSKDQSVGELGRGQYVWQWQRSKGGYRSYPAAQSVRIEEAYRRGHSKVRLKSGKGGQTPMEIFFVDMIQLDPKSRNLRRVRRVGAKSWHVELARHVQAVARSVYSGEPRWESFEKYKKRQQAILGTGQGDLATAVSSYAVKTSRVSAEASYMAQADNLCARINGSVYFMAISMFAMLLNIFWIGVSVELGEFNQSLWDRHPSSIFFEHSFLVYFMAELMIQFFSMKYKSLFFRHSWFCLDALCTATMVLEVLVIPYTGITAGSTPALQVLRLTRLARLLRLFREIQDVVIIIRGMISGMRSAALIWILIAVLLYTCSVLLTTASYSQSDFLTEKYFGSMGQTTLTLIAHGIALDACGDFLNDLRMHDGLFQGVIFCAFVFLTYFGLLNMLVGAFCNVAIEVADIEKDFGEIGYLHSNLEGIVECYMEDGKDHINNEKFQLIMKNADVLQTLKRCGTDLDGLMMLSEVLFPHADSEISFPEFFSVIVRLRKGKPASVSEIIGLQEFTKQKMDNLEELIRSGMRIEVEDNLSKRGSVLDLPRVRSRIAHQDEEIHPEQRRHSLFEDAAKKTEAEKVRKNWIRS